MTRLVRILYPDREIEIPRIERKRKSTAWQYSPPIREFGDIPRSQAAFIQELEKVFSK